jgi:hypothetical protein
MFNNVLEEHAASIIRAQKSFENGGTGNSENEPEAELSFRN